VKRRFNISKNWFGVILLAAYSSVFLVNVACNIEREVELYASEEASKTAHHHPDLSAIGHVHHSHGENHSHDHDTSTDNSDDDDCCDDDAAIGYVSISNTTPPSFNVLKIDLPSLQMIASPSKLLGVNSPYSFTTAYLNKAPPLKIPDIRVLIQSFLI